MQGQDIKRPSINYGLLFQIITACGIGLMLGIASGLLSGLLVFGLLVAVFVVYVISKRPEFALLGILITTASIVFEDQLPLLPLGGISIHIPDLLLLGMLGLVILRWLVEPKFRLVRTPLDLPLLLFFGITLLSTFIAFAHSSLDAVLVRRAFRVISYYLLFFAVTNLVRERRQLDFLLKGLFFLATLVALVMVAQYVLGNSVILLPGRVETLNTQGVNYSDITRILPPGLSIVLVAFVVSFCTLILDKFRPVELLNFFQFGVLGLAVLFTFLRSYWSGLIVVFFLLFFILGGENRPRLISWGMAIICTATLILAIIYSMPDSEAARLAGASNARLSTVFSIDTFQGQDGSLNYRKIENEYALPQILSHPLLGLGLGARYRPWDTRLGDVEGDGRSFIHNGHLLVLLQSGFVGYLCFLWLSLTFLMRGLKYWYSIASRQLAGVVLGFTLVYVVVLIAAVVNSAFMQWFWTPVLGIIMGVNEVILCRFR
jgi:O-antigen ligase